MLTRLHFVGAGAVVVLSLFSSPTAQAAPINLANGRPVVGGNSDYSTGDFNTGGNFATSNVTDGQNAADPTNTTGVITEPSQDGSFWLGRDNQPTGYFVLDLGSPQAIGQIVLFNTRNGPYNDRGTGNFTISASNTVQNLGPSLGLDLTGGTQIVSGSMTPQTYVGAWGLQGNTPITPDTFNVANHTPFRYVRFDVTSIGAAADKTNPQNGAVFGPAGIGLNEIRIMAVPEPGSIALLACGAIGLAAVAVGRRRDH